MSQVSINTLDVQDLLSGDASRKKDFIAKLGKSFQEIGFAILKNHPVTESIQKDAYDKIGKFFALPKDLKQSYSIKGIGGARGYTAFGVEHAKDSDKGDLKEFFHVGVEVPKGHPLEKAYPANVQVKEILGFDDTMRSLYSELHKLGTKVLGAIALYLELPENYFDEYTQYGNSILRPIHYPPLTGQEEPGAIRSAAHEDINLITLLIGASTPGLQAKSKNGDWVAVTPNPHEIVINVGDMLQRLTNYRLVSTTHRVVNPPKDYASSARYSVPFFFHPISEMSLKALDTCVNASNPVKSPPITAGAYLEQRLREIGLY